jgi:hypothetical protein
MKKKLSLCVLLTAGFASYAQIEVDDMYFNSKDRAKLRAAVQTQNERQEQQLREDSKKNLGINPTDSYSARNVNPEYASRLRTNPSSQEEEVTYFTAGYQPISVNPALRNSYYGPGAFSSPFYGSAFSNPYAYTGFGSPYNFYPSWNDPFNNYYNQGMYSSWSLSMGYGWNSWYPRMGYGWNSWGMPSSLFWDSYYGYSSYNSMAWGGGWNSWGSPYGYSGYGYNYYNRYPSQVIIVNNDNGGRQVVYGKRQDRSSSLNNEVDNSRSVSSYTRTGREISNGRTRSESNEQPTYYDRTWKRNPEVAQSQNRSFWGNESNTPTRQSAGGSNNSGRQRTSAWSNDSFNNNSNSNQRSWSNSNTSSFSNSGSRSQPSGGNSSSGSSGTRSRGRD